MENHTIKKYLIIVTLFIYQSISYADNFAKFKDDIQVNVVKVRAKYQTKQEERGFGLIMFEKYGELYIATPKHIIEDFESKNRANASSISISLFRVPYTVKAEVIKKHDKYDLALLKTSKPKGFVWNNDKLSGSPLEGQKVMVLGSNWQWETVPTKYSVFIAQLKQQELIINTSVKSGTSGGLVFTDRQIIGMVTHSSDEENVSHALRLDAISKIVHLDWLNNDLKADVNKNKYPYFTAGIQMGLLNFAYGLGERTSYPGGVQSFTVDYIMSPKIGLRYSYFDGYIDTGIHAETRDSRPARFYNSFQYQMVYTMIGTSIATNPYTFLKRGGHYIYIGLGQAEHNPQLEISGSGLKRLDSYDEFKYSYNDTFYLFSVGVSKLFYLSPKLSIGINLDLTMTNEKYFTLNPSEPFKENAKNDSFVSVLGSINYTFGKPYQPPFKILY